MEGGSAVLYPLSLPVRAEKVEAMKWETTLRSDEVRRKELTFLGSSLDGDRPRGDYSNLIRFDPNGRYPPFRIKGGVLETEVRSGTLQVNGTSFDPGNWVRLGGKDAVWRLEAGEDGCELFAVVRGQFVVAEEDEPPFGAQQRKEVVGPEDRAWETSPEVSGLQSRRIWVYGDSRLGNEGIAPPGTHELRLQEGAEYPPIALLDGFGEIWIRTGCLAVNDQRFGDGTYLLVPPALPITLRSPGSVELTVVWRGRATLV